MATDGAKERFEEPYLNTRYEVCLENGQQITLRIGQECAEINRYLIACGAEDWAFISAYNPRSTLLADEDNEQRAASLKADVSRKGLRHALGRGIGLDEQWPPEPSLWIIGIPRQDLIELAVKYEQNAVVIGSLLHPPELLWTDLEGR